MMESLDEIKKHIESNNVVGKSHAGFEVPDNYFNALNEKILAQAVSEDKPRSINWFKFSAAAASICVLIACVCLLTSQEDNPTADFAMADITEEESYDYIMNEELDDFTTEDILELEDIDEILEELEQELAN